ncbi:MAG: CBS domain-containing protein [Phycisphaerae bacterium]
MWQHTRVPVFDSEDPEKWIGFVLKDDVVGQLAADRFAAAVETLCKPLGFVPETAPGHLLLNEFIKQRQHILGVVDEYGGLAGVVTLEDVLESLIGEEIVDETDLDEDMRAVARRSAAGRIHRSKDPGKDQGPSLEGAR